MATGQADLSISSAEFSSQMSTFVSGWQLKLALICMGFMFLLFLAPYSPTSTEDNPLLYYMFVSH